MTVVHREDGGNIVERGRARHERVVLVEHLDRLGSGGDVQEAGPFARDREPVERPRRDVQQVPGVGGEHPSADLHVHRAFEDIQGSIAELQYYLDWFKKNSEDK